MTAQALGEKHELRPTRRPTAVGQHIFLQGSKNTWGTCVLVDGVLLEVWASFDEQDSGSPPDRIEKVCLSSDPQGTDIQALLNEDVEAEIEYFLGMKG